LLRLGGRPFDVVGIHSLLPRPRVNV
jgi:hypothetical protein